MKNNKGFSLVELMVVIIIVGILSFVSFNMYKRYKKNAIMTEGKALLSSLIDFEDVYYTEKDIYFSDNIGFRSSVPSSETKIVGINAASNKYFRTFNFIRNGSNVTIQVKDTKGKITMQVVMSPNSEPVYTETVN